MLKNSEVAGKFRLLAKLLELHGENPFRIRSYTNAYLNIKKWPVPVLSLSQEELATAKGIGKTIQAKILELAATGQIQKLEEYLEKTPVGVVEMLGIKGFGPKKISIIWKEMGIETVGELLYAINENRLVELKGFGQKTQADLKKQLAYHQESADKLLYPIAHAQASELLTQLDTLHPQHRHGLTGALRQGRPTIDTMEILTTLPQKDIDLYCQAHPLIEVNGDEQILNKLKLKLHSTTTEDYVHRLAETSSDIQFWEALKIQSGEYEDEATLFEQNKLPHYIPEYREHENLPHKDDYPGAHNLITQADLKGCIHNHSTWSDGLQSISEMMSAAMDRGYEYFVITDHSKSAIYANGLSIDRLLAQLDEIMELDRSESDFRLFSGIESDILADGRLDYPDELLSQLDVVVASIHSSLKMDQIKATERLIRAIENPYTSILGHPTGRLLLSRPAYPIDHAKVIDACADNNVAIELNANPNRLDMDWRWIHRAMAKDVLISINPDAHSIGGLDDTAYGVMSARKGGLTPSYCLNAMDIDEFEEWLEGQHEKR